MGSGGERGLLAIRSSFGVITTSPAAILRHDRRGALGGGGEAGAVGEADPDPSMRPKRMPSSGQALPAPAQRPTANGW